MKPVFFERAIFLSWYCGKGDCKFCYMSTIKDKIKNPLKARRSMASILAEVMICKKCNWNIEFLSGGYESYSKTELFEIIKNVTSISKEKLWLNIGALNEDYIETFSEYLEGLCGAVETIEPKLRNEVCPSKYLEDIEEMFELCDKYNLKKSMTFIIGLGEKIEHFSLLKRFISKHNISKITFYALNPHPGTGYTKGPEKSYYAKWIKLTRSYFPSLEIVAGSWDNRLDEISMLLDSGADNITKFKAIKLFNTEKSKQLCDQVKRSKREFISNFSRIPIATVDDLPDKFDEKLKVQIIEKYKKYFKIK